MPRWQPAHAFFVLSDLRRSGGTVDKYFPESMAAAITEAMLPNFACVVWLKCTTRTTNAVGIVTSR